MRYLKTNRGRHYYQRRIPDQFQELLGKSKWQMPCGNVSHAKAVQLVVTWAEEHDDLIARLRSPEGYNVIEADILRAEDTVHQEYVESLGAPPQSAK